ncbi:MAG TPA: hypothetical protein VGK90_10430 [Rhizomicrobium sp.]|jgi:hypothetical protein
MKSLSCLAAAAISVVLCYSIPVLADDDDYPSWQPNSPAATSITGPIIVLPNRLHAGNTNFPMKLDSSVTAFKPGQSSFPARIYAVTSTDNPTLLNGNKLCGDTPPKWIVVVPQPPLGLEIDAFTSEEKPASADSPGLCKALSYTR